MASDIDYVLGFVFSEDSKSLLLIKKDHPAWQLGKLNGVGGKIMTGEPPSYAMSRECAEESGIRIMPEDWRPFAIMIGQGDTMDHAAWRVFCFVAVVGPQLLFSARAIEKEAVMIVNVDFYREHPTVHNLHWLIEMAQDKGITDPLTVLYPPK